MSTLAQLEARVAARLVDAANAVFSTATIDEALRTALSEYTGAAPLTTETVITLPGSGREIALATLTGLIGVTDVYWPYDSTAPEVWPPNRVRGFQLQWDDAQPLLVLTSFVGEQPQADDELRLWYTKSHTIQNLDSGALTTLPAHHESALVTGACSYVALGELIDQIGAIHLDTTESAELRRYGSARLEEWQRFLARLAASGPAAGPAFSSGWQLDRYDDYRR